jgi:hypothetical protein
MSPGSPVQEPANPNMQFPTNVLVQISINFAEKSKIFEDQVVAREMHKMTTVHFITFSDKRSTSWVIFDCSMQKPGIF